MLIRMEKLSQLAILALVITLVGAQIDDSGCGSSKGCFREPTGCAAADCDYIVTWAAAAGNVKMELQGKIDGWVAVGFSKDQGMGDDSVYECLSESGTVTVQSSYNELTKGATTTLGEVDISATSGTFANGVTSCSFTRPIKNTDPKVYAVDTPLYLLLGVGPVSSGSKSYHSVIPSISDKMVDISSSVEDVGGAGPSALVRAHGILMMSAWTMFVCTAILMARYFKKGFPEKKLCDGMPVWFSLHRILNTGVLLLTVVAFILIFVDVQGWSATSSSSTVAQAHPILGVIITALAITNPIMALFRPHPEEDKRVIFNWAHYAVGTIASILALINTFFGMTLGKAEAFLQTWVRWVLIAFSILYSVVILVLEIHQHCCTKQAKGQEDATQMQPVAGESDTSAPKPLPQGMMFKYAVLTVYLVLGALLWIIMFIAFCL